MFLRVFAYLQKNILEIRKKVLTNAEVIVILTKLTDDWRSW